ncbi:replicative DNA helicase [Magnetospira sp. QH-2]|uniref:replicative DNA helicase n=1 Tax=Magnetospira sp. (strain QH-2) TaxID=1288970 RepID=UPI0003E817CF|nr:replicative DNA helicase [Magnetospira sp. QH-2]CCQ74432.1 Replicative DNA helicase [Magnetospira sp. QH-2]
MENISDEHGSPPPPGDEPHTYSDPVPGGLPERDAFRAPPRNYEAEKSLIGAILANNRAHERVAEFLRPEHFADPVNGMVFEAITLLVERSLIADLVTLRNYFESNQQLADVGGIRYLTELADAAVTIINATEYGRIIYDLHLKRELIDLGEEVVNSAFDSNVGETANSQIEAAEQRLYDLATSGETEGGFKPFKDSVLGALNAAEAAHKRTTGLAGCTTGLRDLDKMLGGLHSSDLLILAGRPSMGKTALATNIAYNAAYSHARTNGEEGAVVGFFSLEMSAEQLAARIISQEVQISSDRMRKGELSNDEFTRLVSASQALYQLPFFIDDTPALTVSALRTRARRLKRQHGLSMIVVDYLQLISGAGNKNENRVQELSEITRGLKTLAKELNLPVIALSQLSRAVEQREPPRPQLSDLRESGSIEQDADVVMFIYRAEYYLERKRPDADDVEKAAKWEERLDRVRNLADVIIAKQRHGPVGDITLQFTGQFTRFGDLDTTHGGDYE